MFVIYLPICQQIAFGSYFDYSYGVKIEFKRKKYGK
jgi:hypothetical protein